MVVTNLGDISWWSTTKLEHGINTLSRYFQSLGKQLHNMEKVKEQNTTPLSQKK